MNKLIRTIHPEVRVIDQAKGIVDYVASDETLDCYREIIRADGWRFTHFAKNAPFVDSHDYGTIEKLLGKVLKFWVEGRHLINRVQWALDVPGCELAKLGFALTAGGYLKAVSVGFFPKRACSKWDSDPKGYNDAIAAMKVTPEDAKNLRTIYLEQEQIELSACILGANPNALAKAHIDGVAKDETLAQLGFDDDGLQFLHESAAAYDEATPAQRAFIKLEMRRLTAGSHKSASASRRSCSHGAASPGGETRQPSDAATNKFRQEEPHRAAPPNDDADGEAAIRRRRGAFLAELTAVTTTH